MTEVGYNLTLTEFTFYEKRSTVLGLEVFHLHCYPFFFHEILRPLVIHSVSL